MRVHALLSEHRHAGASLVHKSGDGLVQPTIRQMQVQTGVLGVSRCGMLLISSQGVVSLAGDFPADAVPDLLQILQRGRKYFFGVAPYGDKRCGADAGFANHVAVR